MPDTSRAIGAVTDLLADKLQQLTGIASVTSGRPEPANGERHERINVFLYEATVDASLRSHALASRPPPVWLALRYLVTAYDDSGESDTSDAHRILGKAIHALHGLSYLPLDSAGHEDQVALRASPEPLKLSFLPAASDLLGKVMQGSDEKYRCSIAVEVRPVMIASAEPSEDALLVGHRYRGTDPRAPGVHINLDPVPAPSLVRAEPARFEVPSPAVRLIGTGFGPGDTARLGPIEVPITGTSAAPTVTFPDISTSGGPGAWPLAVIRTTSTGRRRLSDPVVVRVLPTLLSATITGAVPAESGRVNLTLQLDGVLLGRDDDDSIVALWSDGRTVASVDKLQAGSADQATRTVVFENVARGAAYFVILSVNGAQAVNSPEIRVS